MDQIQHNFVDVGGLKLHVADIGTGPNVVVFLHGFPEKWCSWRHQMIALAGAGGFCAIVPDYRGYGLSDRPPEPDKATFSDILNDLLGMLDAFDLAKAYAILLCPFWEPGRAEADFGRLDAKAVVRNICIIFSRSETPVAEKNQEVVDLVDPSTPLPTWLTEEDLAA